MRNTCYIWLAPRVLFVLLHVLFLKLILKSVHFEKEAKALSDSLGWLYMAPRDLVHVRGASGPKTNYRTQDSSAFESVTLL